ncbi:MAG: hypothetical protein K6F09_05160 [Clostridiales bacterium]|nr:hypothetical protein [Clostridiales bacterium]
MRNGFLKNIKEMKTMLAMLWTTKIILGKKTYADVPRLLKEQVAECLAENGFEELAEA